LQQDLLENIEAREYFPETGSPGGKIATHEFLDAGADHGYQRTEILSTMSQLLDRKNNVRLEAAHKLIIKDGTEQAVASNHCFSCHLTSKSKDVKSYTHQIKAELSGEVGQTSVAYGFGYRSHKSRAADPYAYYDEAKHPVNASNVDEFGSRLVFDDTTVAFAAEPATEKVSHKLRLKTDVGKTRLTGAISYNRAENQDTELAVKNWYGTFHMATPLSSRARLVGKVVGQKTSSDDYWVDVPTFREGRQGTQLDADYWRASVQDRTVLDFSAEVINRLNRQTTLAVLAGYNRIDREFYAFESDNLITSRFSGQVKLRYRKGLDYSTSLKLRYEMTSDPFVSSKGLFEGNGSLLLDNPTGVPNDLVFYFQRESIRYQAVTTEPTDYMEVDWKGTWRTSAKSSLMAGVKYIYDKNGDLDSLDVEHSSLQPNLAFTVLPSPRWSLTGGVSYLANKSRGPVAVALFDG
jgi:hypothetical protein